jgi:WD40 repeat protein
MMATGNDRGDVAVWDMEKRQLAHLLPHAHDAAVATLVFFPGEPVLLTTSADNTLKVCVYMCVSVCVLVCMCAYVCVRARVGARSHVHVHRLTDLGHTGVDL